MTALQITTNQADPKFPVGVRGWPCAGISDERAAKAHQRALADLRVAEHDPSLIATSDDKIVAKAIDRKDENLYGKDLTAEMWARARLMSCAPKMYKALQVIANQSTGPDYTPEEAMQFVKQFAKEILVEARGHMVTTNQG